MSGLALRICLIVAAALAFIVVMVFGVLFLQREDAPRNWLLLPLPNQVAAMVEIIEETPLEQRPLLLSALSSPALDVSVVDTLPDSTGTVELPFVRRVVGFYLEALGGRRVHAMIDASRGDATGALNIRGERVWARFPTRLVVGLRTGEIMVVELKNDSMVRFTGLRLAVIVLIATIVIGLVSLWAVQRQIKPIQRLADAVSRFGAQLDMPELKEEGAGEVRGLIAAVNRMQHSIRDLMGGRTRMMAAIGHDLGTYLTRLRLRAEFIADDEQRARAIRDIEEMHVLMSDTLTLAKLEDGKVPKEETDLVALARRCVEGFAASGMAVRLHTGNMPVCVMAQEAAIGRVLDNLILNALKYGGGEADVTISRQGGLARIMVEDRGPGIPPSERETVLEPFHRLDTARNLDEGGSGLGLAIVADIVRRHSGTISLGDRPGGGLSVSIDLALAPDEPS